MNKDIVMCYGIAANCDIAKEEAAELIHAISTWERATLPWHCETDTTPQDAWDNLIQALADCQNAMDSLVYKICASANQTAQMNLAGDARKASILWH
jgi:hypothetical protein|uniref:Uncharacterized protein n=1 Tax=Myoviridae sp. ctAca11 TaxID=2825043 RepID=A0A8S5Q863_9CAUD|nr:MAG TPA: hypothetical protein [Myoviridae sp. ctAca11]